jgi:hypothetical protein
MSLCHHFQLPQETTQNSDTLFYSRPFLSPEQWFQENQNIFSSPRKNSIAERPDPGIITRESPYDPIQAHSRWDSMGKDYGRVLIL